MGVGATHRRLTSVGVHIRRKDYVGILVIFRSGKNRSVKFYQEFDTPVFCLNRTPLAGSTMTPIFS